MNKSLKKILIYGINLCLLIWDLVYNLIPLFIFNIFIREFVITTILLLGGLFRSKLLSDFIKDFKRDDK